MSIIIVLLIIIIINILYGILIYQNINNFKKNLLEIIEKIEENRKDINFLKIEIDEYEKTKNRID